MSRSLASSPAIELDDCWNRIGVWRSEETVCPRLKEFTHCHNCPIYRLAGQRVLQREMPEQEREEWTRIYAQQQLSSATDTESAVIFRIGDEWLAIASGVVNEVTSTKSIQRLPHTRQDVVKGLVNIRGTLEICIGLGGLIGIERGLQGERYGTVGTSDRMLLIEKDSNRYVFPVTEVHGIHHFPAYTMHPVPATVSRAKATYTHSMLHWNDQHVGMLDDELLFYTLNRSLK